MGPSAVFGDTEGAVEVLREPACEEEWLEPWELSTSQQDSSVYKVTYSLNLATQSCAVVIVAANVWTR